MTKQQQNTIKVLQNMIEMVQEEPEYGVDFACLLESGLNELASYDAFGTEQSTDPRGDFRNGSWDLEDVEGFTPFVDELSEALYAKG